MSGIVWSVRYLSSSLFSKTERQLTFMIVRRLGVCLALGFDDLAFGGFKVLGDDEACGGPKLEVIGELVDCDK